MDEQSRTQEVGACAKKHDGMKKLCEGETPLLDCDRWENMMTAKLFHNSITKPIKIAMKGSPQKVGHLEAEKLFHSS